MKQGRNDENVGVLQNFVVSVWAMIWKFKIVIVLLIVLYLIHYNFLREYKSREELFADGCLEGTKYVEDNFANLDQMDPELVRYVRTRYLIPPTSPNVPYHFKNPGKDIKTGHGQWVRKYLKDKRGGVFIEAGANEGEFHSHTLELEMELGWSGLLIECNPTVTPYLRSKRRKAWVAGVCISTGNRPAVLNFSNPEGWTYSGRIGPAWNLPVASNWTYFDVESVPLYTIIAAAGYKEIDFFSFDVEGIEFEILRQFPFDRIVFKLIIMEVQFIDQTKRDELEAFMKSKGYSAVEKQGLDHIYKHESLIVD